MIRTEIISTTHPLYPQACDLRERVLLRPIGLSLERFRELYPGYDERADHIVAVVDLPTGRRVVGCGLLIPDEPEPGVGKLSQMAVDPQRQGEGIGRRIVTAIESQAFGPRGLTRLKCHAQTTAVGFYQRLGWAVESEEFQEAGIPHHRMSIEGWDSRAEEPFA